MSPLRTITLSEPVVEGNSLVVSWSVSPETDFYTQDSFRLDFPAGFPLATVPEGLLFRAMLCCLHSHWAVLRPCRVVLPRRLPDGEAEFWMRLIDAATWTLESDHEDSTGADFIERTRRSAEIVCSGPPAGPLPPARDEGVVINSFSGGRDSLTQLGVLQELGETVILATTTSSREGSREFETERRRSVIDQIGERRGVELIEVNSDFRTSFNNFHPRVARYQVAVTELTDTLVYFAVCWIIGWARGANAIYLASEAEANESLRLGGVVAQLDHFAYSGATQMAMRELIAPTGIDYGGLTASLIQFQIQRILGRRYPDLRDMQYSCYEQREGENVCSRCRSCFKTALNLTSDGIAPREIEIDLEQVLIAQSDWTPRGILGLGRGLVGDQAGRYADDHVIRFFREHDADAIARFADGGRLSPEARAAVERLRETAFAEADPTEEPGYRAEYIELAPARSREGIESIIQEFYSPDPPASYASLIDNTRTLSHWIAAPLERPTAGDNHDAAHAAHAAPERPAAPPRVEPSPRQLAEIAASIPGPEPEINHGSPNRYLPVADADLSGDELRNVVEAVESGWVSSAGPYVERLEGMFAEACGTRYAVATASGASALELMLRAGGVGPGDEVIMPTFTMVATANAVHHIGAKVVFVDSDPATWNMDLAAVRRAIGPRTRAIMAMHTYGHPVDMDALREIAGANCVALFEDAAEAHGARVRGQRVGSFGDAAAFSFYGNKIVTSGEGGMITTDDAALAQAARDLRSHSFSEDRHFWHRRRAFNYRMSNLQAAIGVAQVERLEEFLAKRRELAALYREHLAPLPGITLPPLEDGLDDANWMFGIMLDEAFPCSRDELRARLADDAIETRTFFVPLHLQPAYLAEFEGRRHPVAEAMGMRGLYLPSALWLTEDDVARIAERIAQATGTAAEVGSSPNPA